MGGSWEALGSLLGALGLLLAALGAILERHAKIIKKSMPKMTDFGSPKPPQPAPKSNQKTIKNQCKKRSAKRNEIRPSWDCLGAILGHLWSPLGVIFIDFSLVFKAFREHSLFAKHIASRAVLTPIWPNLGRFWRPKWSNMALQNDLKTIKKHVEF